MKRIVLLGLVLALLAAMLISSGVLAAGTCDGSQARQGAMYQYGSGSGAGDGTGLLHRCVDLNGDDICGKP